MFLELRELLVTEQFVSSNILGEWIMVIMSSCLHDNHYDFTICVIKYTWGGDLSGKHHEQDS
jgi:hypothetical protein